MADIEIVHPVPGATRVSFNYGAASSALDALSKMGSKLSEQSTGRATLHDSVVVNWLGYFRNEYDRAHNLMQLTITAGVEMAGYAGLPIWEAIAAANQRQRELNAEYQESQREDSRAQRPA